LRPHRQLTGIENERDDGRGSGGGDHGVNPAQSMGAGGDGEAQQGEHQRVARDRGAVQLPGIVPDDAQATGECADIERRVERPPRGGDHRRGQRNQYHPNLRVEEA